MISAEMQKACDNLSHKHHTMMKIMFKWIFALTGASLLASIGILVTVTILAMGPPTLGISNVLHVQSWPQYLVGAFFGIVLTAAVAAKITPR